MPCKRPVMLFLVLLLGVLWSLAAVQVAAHSPQTPNALDGVDSLLIGAPLEDIRSIFDAGVFAFVPGAVLAGLQPGNATVWTQDVVPDRPEDYDEFATAFAVGDFNGDGYFDVAVGIPFEDIEMPGSFSPVEDAGMVNVFYSNADGPTAANSQILLQPDADVEESDGFGAALAAGDFNGDGFDDLAVGVPLEDVETATGVFSDAGRVDIFYGRSTGLNTIATATLWQESSGDNLGFSLAAGDFDNDGYDDLAVGAPYWDFQPNDDAGAVYVVYGEAGGFADPTWQQYYQYGSGSEQDDHFGRVLAVGDFNGDDYDDLAVGVPGEDIYVSGSASQITDAGAVFILASDSTSWLSHTQEWWQNAILDNGSPIDPSETGDYFGFSLATGDYNDDGYDDLWVGVPWENMEGGIPPTDNVGLVQFIRGASDGTHSTAYCWWGSVGDDRFGLALAAGDFDGDRYADFAVGQPGWDLPETDTGQVMIYYSDGTDPGGAYVQTIGQGDIPGMADEAGDNFGTVLAMVPAPLEHVYLPLIMR